MSLTYQQEQVEMVETDIIPLMHAHNDELQEDISKEYPLDVSMDTYRRLDKAGSLRIFTARDDGVLAGYATFFVIASHHRRTMVVAHEDALYMKPEYRRGRVAMRLMKFAEDALRATCKLVIYHCPTAKPHFGILLTKLGYEPYATYHVRRL